MKVQKLCGFVKGKEITHEQTPRLIIGLLVSSMSLFGVGEVLPLCPLDIRGLEGEHKENDCNKDSIVIVDQGG